MKKFFWYAICWVSVKAEVIAGSLHVPDYVSELVIVSDIHPVPYSD
jgi:hypothetical protein